jgi:hypothetical protein
MKMYRSGSSICKPMIHSFSGTTNSSSSELKTAKLLAKPSEQLTGDNPLLSNGCKLMINGDEVALAQKEQGKRLGLIGPNFDEAEVRQVYLE